MTIINADAKALEVVCAAYLSQDKIMMQEIIDKVDIHSANQELFNIPRLIAKILKFRIIYGGTEYSFAEDPDFAEISTSPKYWKKVIDKYFEKYPGLASWHGELLRQVVSSGKIITPTGRTFMFEPIRKYNGEWNWPITQIKNFPVQSIGADLMSIARVSFMKRFRDANINGIIVNTVHDSIVCDVDSSEIIKVGLLFHDVFRDIPTNFNRLFGVLFNLPLTCEVSVGNNMKELTEYKI
jgi:DNA polymerase-1